MGNNVQPKGGSVCSACCAATQCIMPFAKQTTLVTCSIGSHTVVQLLQIGASVVILDNLYDSKRDYVHVDDFAAGHLAALKVLNVSPETVASTSVAVAPTACLR